MSLTPQFQKQFFNAPEHLIAEAFVLQPSQAQQWEYQQLLAPLKNYSKKIKILEVGCGSGRITFELLRRGYAVTAYDISEKPLRLLKQRYLKHKQSGWGQLTVTTKLQKKPFADVLIGADILHHVDITIAMAAWKTQLKPGGLAIFSEPNGWYPLWYVHFYLQRIPWKVEAGIINCTAQALRQQFAKWFTHCTIEGHGLIPPVVFQQPQKLAQYNATQLVKKFPAIAFRLFIFAK